MAVLPINFGPWLPDRPSLNNEGLSRAFSVLPGDGSYMPVKSERLYANTVMQGTPLGATSGFDDGGNAVVLGGDAHKLYRLQPGNTVWEDITRVVGGPYNGSDMLRWRFAEYGMLTIATNLADFPQVFDRSLSTRFTNLTDKVKGRYITVLKDFVVLANIYTADDGEKRNWLMWSAAGDPGQFESTAANLSDFNIINGYGDITGIIGGEYGIILMERGIVRMTFTQDESIFQFDPMRGAVGCTVPQSVIEVEGRIFFLNDDGFYEFNGERLNNIGRGKINSTFLKKMANTDRFSSMTVEKDPSANIVYWMYESKNAVGDKPDRMLIYNYATENWTECEAGAVGSLYRSMSLPYTIEQLAAAYPRIEDIPAPWDSPVWSGGKPQLGGLDMEGRPFLMTGANRIAELQTGEFQIARLIRQVDPKAVGERAMVRSVRPDVHAEGSCAISARVGYRNILQELSSSTAYVSTNVLGECPQHVDSRYQRVDLRLEGDWSQAMGFQLDAVCTGSR